jgi:hypothetical protein
VVGFQGWAVSGGSFVAAPERKKHHNALGSRRDTLVLPGIRVRVTVLNTRIRPLGFHKFRISSLRPSLEFTS